MQILHVAVDMVFEDSNEFVCRVLWQDYRKKIHRSGGPIYGRRLNSGSFQLYDIDGGSIRKFGNGVVKAPLVDFTHAVYQTNSPELVWPKP